MNTNIDFRDRKYKITGKHTRTVYIGKETTKQKHFITKLYCIFYRKYFKVTWKTVQKCARISTENKEMSTCLKEDINQPPEDKFTVTNRCRTEEKQSHFVLKECNIVIIVQHFAFMYM